MINSYYFLSKIFLLIPILAIISSFSLNKYVKIQKIVNNITYSSFTVVLFLLLFFSNIYGQHEITLFNISTKNPVIFAVNSFNLSFGVILSICILCLNYTFQNSFSFLKLVDKYKFYNKQITFLLFFTLLLIFSHNVLISMFCYIAVLLSSLFLLTNPELKEIRQNYSTTFLVGLISTTFLIIVFSFYFYLNNNLLFVIQNINNASFASIYYVALSLILLYLIVFSLPIYLFFKEKLYYEDFLPSFIIYFFPFVFLNTFLFIKITYYLFNNEFNNLGLYFYYIGFALVGLFIFSLVSAISEIKNALKFTLLFNLSNFLIFLSQVLFVNSDLELIKSFSKFIVLVLAIFSNIFAYSGVLFLLLNSNTTSAYILYKKSKIELNFYILTLFAPVFINVLYFMELNFYNFNVLYFINLIEIAAIFIIFCIFLYFFFIKEPNLKNTPNLKEVSDLQIFKFFIAPLFIFILMLVVFYFKNEIVKIIIR